MWSQNGFSAGVEIVEFQLCIDTARNNVNRILKNTENCKQTGNFIKWCESLPESRHREPGSCAGTFDAYCWQRRRIVWLIHPMRTRKGIECFAGQNSTLKSHRMEHNLLVLRFFLTFLFDLRLEKIESLLLGKSSLKPYNFGLTLYTLRVFQILDRVFQYKNLRKESKTIKLILSF